MEKDQLINRINELAAKKKATGLSEAELIEQKALREEYLNMFRNNIKATLDNTIFVKEFITDKNNVNQTLCNALLEIDGIEKVFYQDDKCHIHYDIKKINEAQLSSLIGCKK